MPSLDRHLLHVIGLDQHAGTWPAQTLPPLITLTLYAILSLQDAGPKAMDV